MYSKGIAVRKDHWMDAQRRVVAHKTVEAWTGTPHVSVLFDLDVTELQRFIALHRDTPDFSGVRLNINAALLKIVAEGLKQAPEMNAHIAYTRHTGVGRMKLFRDINIAVPMLGQGRRIITPILKHVGDRSLRAVCEGIADLKRRVSNTNVELLMIEAARRDTIARLLRGRIDVLYRSYANFFGRGRVRLPDRAARKAYAEVPESERLTADDLLCATILVSNIGSVAADIPVRLSLLEIIAPQTAAIGMAAIQRQPLARTDEHGRETVAVRSVLPMTICFDHRALDFEQVTPFMREVTRLCVEPERLLDMG
jgi:pyruvate/2-oxoglutarate dehydrogenase complex dihydrolipoamide acyltransferase (E2) component